MQQETEDRVVVDASALGAVFFQEPEAAFVEKRLARRIWAAPVLIDYEIGAIFLKKIKLYPKMRRQLDACYEVYNESAIERYDVQLAQAISIAEKHDLTIYDACYFSLALVLNVDILTLDKKLSAAWLRR